MKLLFDQNLSPRLPRRLADLYPGSDHVFELGLERADDLEVWEHARGNGFIITSKDSDFNELSVVHGFPPKVAWIRRGNCSTSEIEEILRQEYESVEDLERNPSKGILELF
jgi:predicted nuclease of predicted toxin-antitoxin system